MSSAHRTLGRLPLEIFEGLLRLHNSDGANDEADVGGAAVSAETLRRDIVDKLSTWLRSSSSSRIRRTTGNTHLSSSCHPEHHQEQQLWRNDTTNGNSSSWNNITTVGSFLRLSPIALLNALDPLLTYSECHELYRRICQHCAPQPITAAELSSKNINSNNVNTTAVDATSRFLATGLPQLDDYLRGGLLRCSVTEIVGCAGTAKTQLALQMALLLAAAAATTTTTSSSSSLRHPTMTGGTIWIDTERKVSLRRLEEMARERNLCHNNNNDHDNNNNNKSSENGLQRLLQSVRIHSPDTLTELVTVLNGLEGEILDLQCSAATSSTPVQLLVIDSIAAPARREGGSAASQAAAVLQIAQTIKRLADQFRLCVLVINQVGSTSSSSSSSNGTNNNNHSNSSEFTVSGNNNNSNNKAALGMAWHHCVSTRIQLELHPQTHVRTASVLKSNLVGPSAPIPFQVTNRGIE